MGPLRVGACVGRVPGSPPLHVGTAVVWLWGHMPFPNRQQPCPGKPAEPQQRACKKIDYGTLNPSSSRKFRNLVILPTRMGNAALVSLLLLVACANGDRIVTDGKQLADAVASLATGADNTLFLGSEYISMRNVTFSSAPFEGLLTVQPGPNVSRPVLDAAMRAGLTVPGAGPAKIQLQGLTLVNLCDWPYPLTSKSNALAVDPWTVALFSRSRSVQRLVYSDLVLYGRYAAITGTLYRYLAGTVDPHFSRVRDLSAWLVANLGDISTVVRHVTQYSFTTGTFTLPASLGSNVTIQSISNPYDPLLNSMRAAGTLMPPTFCNGTVIPASLAEPEEDVTYGPLWLASSGNELVHALTRAAALSQRQTEQDVPPAVYVCEGLVFNNLVAPVTIYRMLWLAGPNKHSDSLEVVLSLAQRVGVLVLAPGAQLYVQDLTLAGLATSAAGSTQVPSALPLQAISTAASPDSWASSPYLWLYNVTLMLPTNDYLALMSLVLGDSHSSMRSRILQNSTISTLAGQLRSGISQLTAGAVAPSLQSFSLALFTGWGINASSLTLKPATPLGSELFLTCSLGGEQTDSDDTNLILACVLGTGLPLLLAVAGLGVWVFHLRSDRRRLRDQAGAASCHGKPAGSSFMDSPPTSDIYTPLPASTNTTTSGPGSKYESPHMRLSHPPHPVAAGGAGAARSSPPVGTQLSGNPPQSWDADASGRSVYPREARQEPAGAASLPAPLVTDAAAPNSLLVLVQSTQSALESQLGVSSSGPDRLVPDQAVGQKSPVMPIWPEGTSPEQAAPQQVASQQAMPQQVTPQVTVSRQPTGGTSRTSGGSSSPALGSLELTAPLPKADVPLSKAGTPSKVTLTLDPPAPVDRVASNDLNIHIKNLAAQLSQGAGGDAHSVVIHHVLGKGSCGTVYAGVWRGLPVALKTMVFSSSAAAATAADGSTGQESMQNVLSHATTESSRAIMEVAIASSVGHRNLVATYCYDIKKMGADLQSSAPGALQVCEEFQQGHANTHAGNEYKIYLVQELCGNSLESGLAIGALQLPGTNLTDQVSVMLLLLDIAQGLEYLHGNGIIHGDLKPANVLLKVDPTSRVGVVAKLADFGFSTHMGPTATHVSNYSSGSPFYVAPEVVHVWRASPASDIYSLGVIMWQMWTSCVPYVTIGDRTNFALDPRFPGFFEPNIPPPAFKDLALQCLRQDDRQRPTATQVISVLHTCLNGGTHVPHTHVPHTPPPPPQPASL